MPDIHALIVDDEESSRENIAMLLGRFCPEVRIVGSVGTLEDAERLITGLNPQLVFLDIQIGKQTVFQMLERLPEINFEIIFITAYDHFAVNAFEFMAIDYLLKPVDIEKFTLAVTRAQENITTKATTLSLEEMMRHIRNFDRKEHKIALSTSKGYEMFYIRDVMYCEASGSYTKFTFAEIKSLTVSKNLKHYEGLLAPYHFVRVHNSTMVNLKYVKTIERSGGGFLVMEDEKQLPVSKHKRKELEGMIKDKRRLI